MHICIISDLSTHKKHRPSDPANGTCKSYDSIISNVRESLGARGEDFQTSRESMCLPVSESCEAAKQRFNEMCNEGSYGSCRRLCVNARKMSLNRTVELFDNCDTECVTEYYQAATLV